jgi:hypothetical protein
LQLLWQDVKVSETVREGKHEDGHAETRRDIQASGKMPNQELHLPQHPKLFPGSLTVTSNKLCSVSVQVQELHRLYRVQKLLMTDAADAMPAIRCSPEDERRAAQKDADSSRSWDAYAEQRKASAVALEETELELTLALGCLRTAENKAAKKETSSSVDSRTSNSSSSTESGSPDCRVVPPPSLIGKSTRAEPASLAPQVSEFGTIGYCSLSPYTLKISN